MSVTTVASKNERRSAWFWTLFVLALFSVNLTVAAFAIVMASGDPSFRPVPSYGDHGIDFQARKTLLEKSDELGWKVQLERVAKSNETPDAMWLQIDLFDRDGKPVLECQGSAKVYHFARVRDVHESSIVADPQHPGRYFADVDLSRKGRWQVELDIKRSASEGFLFDKTVDWFEVDSKLGAKHD